MLKTEEPDLLIHMKCTPDPDTREATKCMKVEPLSAHSTPLIQQSDYFKRKLSGEWSVAKEGGLNLVEVHLPCVEGELWLLGRSSLASSVACRHAC